MAGMNFESGLRHGDPGGVYEKISKMVLAGKVTIGGDGDIRPGPDGGDYAVLLPNHQPPGETGAEAIPRTERLTAEAASIAIAHI